MSSSPYRMSISLNVLNHLGLNLYSNRPAVLAEVIANSWDADATEVRVDFDTAEKTITISDDGCGMNEDDVNSRYLFVGYQKRDELLKTPGGRKPMGRKGIGKLSLFSIADKIYVYSRKKGYDAVGFAMDADKIREAIGGENPSVVGRYAPEPVDSGGMIKSHGTIIKIAELKGLRLTRSSINGLKKRVARRFWMKGVKAPFRIYVDGTEVTLSDRDYFDKARFLFQYGDHDYEKYCKKLDEDPETGSALCFSRPNELKDLDEGTPADWRVGGWIAIAHRSNDLDSADGDENLNRITIIVRRKVAQEDILQEFRLGGMITKYIYGEIHADFLDDDESDDIATSGRQKISEDDLRYRALKSFVEGELRYIWQKTNKLKDRVGLETAKDSNPYVRNWYDSLSLKPVKDAARRLFGAIDRAGIDEAYRRDFYANGILAIESLKMRYALDSLESVDESNLEVFLQHLSDIDAIEAARYHEIVEERLQVIRKLEQSVNENVLEKVLQKYIFDHLWLLDPAWERATEFEEMEKTIQRVVNGGKEKSRLDIRYRRVMVGHVIVELKRADVRLDKADLEKQVRRYLLAVQKELREMNELPEPLEAVCIVGRLPQAWSDPGERKKDEASLRPLSIRIISYKELISNAHSAYFKFAQKKSETEKLRKLIKNIQSYSGSP